MLARLRKTYRRSTLAAKIRFFAVLVLVPMTTLLIFAYFSLWRSNRQYQEMVRSIAAASAFNLDFQKDFDYDTYLLIVGSTTVEAAGLDEMLADANRIVTELEGIQGNRDNNGRLESVRKYLQNLESYKERIEENLRAGGRYEDNMEIWENDVQIVTALIRDTIFEYIFYEARTLQESQESYQRFTVSLLRASVVAFIGIVAAVLLLSLFTPLSITRPIRELSEVTDQVARGNLSVRAPVSESREMAALGESLNVMIDKINELLEQVKDEQLRLHKAEFQILQAQINPHFLYNTLDAIVWLAEDGQQKQVVQMVGSLSEFFRMSLNQGKDIVTVREELLHVRSYLQIQQVRYQDILDYEIDVPAELELFRIPKITIQPLVENALYHGIKNKRGQGKILVTGERQGERFVLCVSDNGIGMTEERLTQVQEELHRKVNRSEGYGMYNVNERIRLNFGDGFGLFLRSRWQEGTQVTVTLPCMEDENRPA